MKFLLLLLLTGSAPITAAPDWVRAGGAVAFLGGENMAATLDHGYFETLSAFSFPEARIQFRNLAWEGDTVFEQSRMLNFGSWRDQFARAGVKTVIAQFGQMEAMKGANDLPRFEEAYRKLIAEWKAGGAEKIILLSPTPFERKEPPLPDLAPMNGVLEEYVERIQTIAEDELCEYADLFHPLLENVDQSQRFTRDGLHWTVEGHWLVARAMAAQLGLETPQSIALAPPEDYLVPPSAEDVRQLILEKNELWFHHWRPMNWAFLWGDRTDQPSSRDHEDLSKRWFPEEIQAFLPMIESIEEQIWNSQGKL